LLSVKHRIVKNW